MKEFAGKTAVVTGAASGIGLALSQLFLERDMNVVMADVEAGKAIQTADGRGLITRSGRVPGRHQVVHVGL